VKPLALAALLATIVACASHPPAGTHPPTTALEREKLVDLSYVYDSTTLYWPNAEGFRHRKDGWAVTEAGYWYAAGEFTSAEHGGTHLDSPVHFAEGMRSVDEIPVEALIGPAAVIDIRRQADADRDYRASPGDILAWEDTHGPISRDSIVVFRTGWGRYWPDRLQYLGDDTPGDTSNLHFPGLSAAAAELLVKRGVAGVGIDTASLDHGPSTDFIVHRILNAANIYGLENVANAELLPARGATLIALPIRIAEGSGSPARIVALLP
jgi:kynurenine formamidase